MTPFRRTHDLIRLARPFPDNLIHEAPKGGDGFGGRYVSHDVYEQKLILVLKQVPEFELLEVIRGFVPGFGPDPNGRSKRAKEGRPALDNAVVGAIARMTVEIDGSVTSVQCSGDCGDPHNWPHDGARLKDAESDAYKRCAMRLGVGLHLWAKNPKEFFLYDQLQSESLVDTETGELEPSVGAGMVPGETPGQAGKASPPSVRGETPAPTSTPVAAPAVASPSADGNGASAERGEPAPLAVVPLSRSASQQEAWTRYTTALTARGASIRQDLKAVRDLYVRPYCTERGLDFPPSQSWTAERLDAIAELLELNVALGVAEGGDR